MTARPEPKAAHYGEAWITPKVSPELTAMRASSFGGQAAAYAAERPAIPTARLILDALATMKIIPGTGHSPPVIPQPTPLQLGLLDLLDTDPRDLR